MQSFLTKTSSTLSTDPEFEAVRNFAVLRNEASQLHLVVHQIRSKVGVLTPVAVGAPSIPKRLEKLCVRSPTRDDLTTSCLDKLCGELGHRSVEGRLRRAPPHHGLPT